ncbi:hypothetical protein ACO229_07265 [Promicromonospora sp. MS192]|uniref:hypothetical protein n=1 Tax=Promicromonospora sp. MS192 TaxID=3412684 RepID=UPI003C2C0B8E
MLPWGSGEELAADDGLLEHFDAHRILIRLTCTAGQMTLAAPQEADGMIGTADLTRDGERMGVTAEEAYGPAMDAADRFAARLAARGAPAERTVAVVERALTDRRPRPRYFVDPGARATPVLKRLLPTRALDAVLTRMMGVPDRVVD